MVGVFKRTVITLLSFVLAALPLSASAAENAGGQLERSGEDAINVFATNITDEPTVVMRLGLTDAEGEAPQDASFTFSDLSKSNVLHESKYSDGVMFITVSNGENALAQADTQGAKYLLGYVQAQADSRITVSILSEEFGNKSATGKTTVATESLPNSITMGATDLENPPVKIDINDVEIPGVIFNAAGGIDALYTGNDIPFNDLVLVYNNHVLTKNLDYSINVVDGDGDVVYPVRDKGVYYLVINGIGDYTGTRRINVTVDDKEGYIDIASIIEEQKKNIGSDNQWIVQNEPPSKTNNSVSSDPTLTRTGDATDIVIAACFAVAAVAAIVLAIVILRRNRQRKLKD